jgi:hypothetical protein
VIRCATGRLVEAREPLRRAADAIADSDARHAALFLAHAACVEADLDRHDAASSMLRVAASRVSNDDPVAIVCRIAEVHIELARSRGARADDEKTRHRSAARKLLRENEPDARAARSIDPRVAWRMAEQACVSSDRDDPIHAPWRVDAEGEWFESPSGERVDCSHRPVLSRLLAHLVRERFASPGRAVRSAELVASGWPGERILPSAARNRLKMCLATLRKLGMRELLRTDAHGYLLDPHVPVERIDAARGR